MKISDVRVGVYFRCTILTGNIIGQIVSVEHNDNTVQVLWVEPNAVEALKMDTLLDVAVEFVSEPEAVE